MFSALRFLFDLHLIISSGAKGNATSEVCVIRGELIPNVQFLLKVFYYFSKFKESVDLFSSRVLMLIIHFELGNEVTLV